MGAVFVPPFDKQFLQFVVFGDGGFQPSRLRDTASLVYRAPSYIVLDPDISCIIDLDTQRLSTFNPQLFQEIFESMGEQLLGRHASGLFRRRFVI